MPRDVNDILNHAEKLADRFEEYEPAPGDERDPATYRALRDAVVRRADAERALRDAILDARSQHFSWASIGGLLGTSGEAARQRYGRPDS